MTSRTIPPCDFGLGSLTLVAPEAGDFVELIKLYSKNRTMSNVILSQFIFCFVRIYSLYLWAREADKQSSAEDAFRSSHLPCGPTDFQPFIESECSQRPTPRAVHYSTYVGKLAQGWIFLRVIPFHFICIMPPVFHSGYLFNTYSTSLLQFTASLNKTFFWKEIQITSPSPRFCEWFRNFLYFHVKELLPSLPTAKLEDHPFSAIRDSYSIY
jgi:hypothetical protein